MFFYWGGKNRIKKYDQNKVESKFSCSFAALKDNLDMNFLIAVLKFVDLLLNGTEILIDAQRQKYMCFY